MKKKTKLGQGLIKGLEEAVKGERILAKLPIATMEESEFRRYVMQCLVELDKRLRKLEMK